MKIQERLKRYYTTDIKSNLAAILLLSFTISVFAPFEIYLSNKDYFFFGGDEMLEFAFLFFFSFAIVLIVFSLFISMVLDRYIVGLSASIWGGAIALYVQGNFVHADYGALDGKTIEWSKYMIEGLVSVGILVAIICSICVILRKVKKEIIDKIIIISSVCILLVQLTTLSTLLIINNGLRKSPEYRSTTKNEFVYSGKEDFVILLLDTFDAQAFDHILSDDCADEYKNTLADFTYYSDTSSIYPLTDLSMPSILSGEYYYNDMTYGDYLNCAYEKSPLLKRLKNEGWYSGFYSTMLLPDNDNSLLFDNCMKLRATVSSHKKLAEYMYKYVGFRYVVQPLKSFFWFYPGDMESDLLDTQMKDVGIFDDSNYSFFEEIGSVETAEEMEKSFHWYHLSGTHTPFGMTADFKSTDENIPPPEGLYEEARAMMKLIDRYLNELRDKGIYDNCTIIIMADHGYFDLSQSPIFMVKGRKDHHEFSEESEIQLSYGDLQHIFGNILEGADTAEKIVDIQKGSRDRKFLFYSSWEGEFGYDTHPGGLVEYAITGNCKDLSELKKTGRIYSFE